MRTALVAILLLGVNAVAAVVSIDEGLPAEFGKGFLGPLALEGDPDNVLTEFVTWRGTAMAAPLVLLIALGVLAVLAAKGSRRATLALGLLGALAFVGYLGEPVTHDALTGSLGAAKMVLVLAGLGLSAGLALIGLADWRERSVSRVEVTAPHGRGQRRPADRGHGQVTGVSG